MIRSEWALRVWLILFVIGIFIVSCSSGIRDQPTNVLKSSISPTVQSEISPTRQPKTATPSELATGITTATNSLSTPTPAPVVTLSLDIAQDKASILTTSADCQLPCWNQLTPGLSAEEDLQGFYAHFGTDIRNIDRIPNKDHSVTYYGGSEPNVFDSPWPIQVTVKNGEVEYIEIYWGALPPFMSLTLITDLIGVPEDIYISTGPYPHYMVTIDYPELGTALVYFGDEEFARLEPDGIQACVNNQQPVTIFLYAGNLFTIMSDHVYYNQENFTSWTTILGTKPEELLHSIIEGKCIATY